MIKWEWFKSNQIKIGYTKANNLSYANANLYEITSLKMISTSTLNKVKAPVSSDLAKPKDLALYVFEKLQQDKLGSSMPNLTVLENLMETMFYASLKTEEGQLLNVTVTLINHEILMPSRGFPKTDNWNFVKFGNAIAFDVKAVTKLAKAADPWSGSLAVYYSADNSLTINGMIDQAVHSQGWINFETETKPDQPGILQVSIIGIGSLSVMCGYEEIATLKHENLIKKYHDVLNRGPVSDFLNLKAAKLKKGLTQFAKETNPQLIGAIDRLVKKCVKKVFSKILIKVQNYHHGGAILFSSKTTQLDIKYKLQYDRLHRAMLNLLKYELVHIAQNSILPDDFDPLVDVDTAYYLRKSNLERQKLRALNEIKGTIRFIASQCCVDGLVLIDQNLTVKGFGVVIKKIKLPEKVWICNSVYAYPQHLRESDPEQHGTRHRSMFSYCWNNPGTLGFVISQDGDIRPVMRIKEKLILWENIQAKQTRLNSNVKHRMIINISQPGYKKGEIISMF
ncbi:putative sensor domain DACNV-containing protein [Pedobacter sp. UC225_65]|uniref:putative sensor domain DACNV-containing protein n=1 Tax=Pedobacter sp. UC225_65 TaxID=3350173 RepID=UPI003672FFD4